MTPPPSRLINCWRGFWYGVEFLFILPFLLLYAPFRGLYLFKRWVVRVSQLPWVRQMYADVPTPVIVILFFCCPTWPGCLAVSGVYTQFKTPPTAMNWAELACVAVLVVLGLSKIWGWVSALGDAHDRLNGKIAKEEVDAETETRGEP